MSELARPMRGLSTSQRIRASESRFTEPHQDTGATGGTTSAQQNVGAALLRRFALSTCFLGGARTLDPHANRISVVSGSFWRCGVDKQGVGFYGVPHAICGHAEVTDGELP